MIGGPEVGEIIPFPVWIIPFPVMKINFELWDQMRNILLKKFFDQMPESGRNNSISYLDNSISCLDNSIFCFANLF